MLTDVWDDSDKNHSIFLWWVYCEPHPFLLCIGHDPWPKRIIVYTMCKCRNYRNFLSWFLAVHVMHSRKGMRWTGAICIQHAQPAISRIIILLLPVAFSSQRGQHWLISQCDHKNNRHWSWLVNSSLVLPWWSWNLHSVEWWHAIWL